MTLETTVLLGKRSRFEMTMDILKSINDGYERPTQIMCRAYTNWITIREMLKELENKGFLKTTTRKTKNQIRVSYYLTDMGLRTLNDWYKIRRTIVKDKPKPGFPRP